MGITDLLKLYKPIIQNMNISELKGKCAGIDIMIWLYRGVYAAMNNSSQEDFFKSDLYLNFPLKMLLLLKEKGINCIAVFDGNNIEAKYSELKSRVDQKKLNHKLALTLAKEGKEEESKMVMKRTLKIKRKMTNTLISLLKKLEIPIIVAPYEADSQLAYLYKHNLIDFAISEDSDLIPYGIERIAFKLDNYGNMDYLDITKAKMVINSIDDDACNWLLSISHYNLVSFCVMLGCDYLASIKGFGTKSGIKLFRSVKDINQVIDRMGSSGKYNVDSEYLKKAKKAISVFYLQTVYDSKKNKLVSLNDFQYYNENDTIDDLIIKSELHDIYLTDKNYYGPFFDDYEDYCKGNIDIKTKSKDIKIESNEVIEKYYRRYSNMLKLTYDVKVLPFKKKVEFITISNTSTQKPNENENIHNEIKKVLDISKEIEYLKNEINKTNENNQDVWRRQHDSSNEIIFLNNKRYPGRNKEENGPIIDEEMLISSLEKIIQEEEQTKNINAKLELLENKYNNKSEIDCSKTITNKYSKYQWKISNNAEIEQSKNASIINDIKLTI